MRRRNGCFLFENNQWLDGVGGIDSLHRKENGHIPTITRRNAEETSSYAGESGVPESSEKLLRELSGKVKSNPEYVNRRLTEAAREAGIEVLTGIAWTNPSRNDIVGTADLGSMALEVAKKINSETKPLRDRATNILTIIRAYRQLEGTLDPDLLKSGFLLVKQLKEEISKPSATQQVEMCSSGCQFNIAEHLEILLVTELSKDSFEKAMTYVRSMENNNLKFPCFFNISTALSRPNF
jgi:hypothetical protein